MTTTKLNSATKIFLAIGLFLLISACQQNSTGYAEDLKMEATDVSAEYDGIETSETGLIDTENETSKVPKDLKIIKSANARYKVKNVKLATDDIKRIAAHFDAYISDLRYENTLYQIENRFTIKVPKENFDKIMDSIGSVAEFTDYENITTKDVSEEYIDLSARLQTKLEVKKRYEEILRRNATTVKDILATEDKLRIIQEEIESAQGRLNYLSNKVAYSTIQVDLYETVEYTEEPTSYKKSFVDKSKNGFSFGWNMIETVVLFIIHIWPVLLLALGLYIFLRKRFK